MRIHESRSRLLSLQHAVYHDNRENTSSTVFFSSSSFPLLFHYLLQIIVEFSFVALVRTRYPSRSISSRGYASCSYSILSMRRGRVSNRLSSLDKEIYITSTTSLSAMGDLSFHPPGRASNDLFSIFSLHEFATTRIINKLRMIGYAIRERIGRERRKGL